MSELLKKQNYGVEVEFTGITRAMAAKAVAEVIGSTVTGPDHTCYHTRIIPFNEWIYRSEKNYTYVQYFD